MWTIDWFHLYYPKNTLMTNYESTNNTFATRTLPTSRSCAVERLKVSCTALNGHLDLRAHGVFVCVHNTILDYYCRAITSLEPVNIVSQWWTGKKKGAQYSVCVHCSKLFTKMRFLFFGTFIQLNQTHTIKQRFTALLLPLKSWKDAICGSTQHIFCQMSRLVSSCDLFCPK